jgi:DNA-binding MarR family transcriptional regulator
MSRKGTTIERAPSGEPPGAARVKLPLESSVGYQMRLTHRLIQRLLQARIAPHGVQLGMWYLLRVLWDEDGLTQRELSNRIGIMEPTTLHTLATMERSGLIKRVRNIADRRKINVFLTQKGRHLQTILLPIAGQVVKELTRGFTKQEVEQCLEFLRRMQRNVRGQLKEVEAGELDFAEISAASAAGPLSSPD